MKLTRISILIALALSTVIIVLVLLTITRPSLFNSDLIVKDPPELSLPEGTRAHLG